MSIIPVSTQKCVTLYNPIRRVDFNDQQILTSSPEKFKLLTLESLDFQQLKPSLNLDSKSFLSTYLTCDHRFLLCVHFFSVSMA